MICILRLVLYPCKIAALPLTCICSNTRKGCTGGNEVTLYMWYQLHCYWGIWVHEVQNSIHPQGGAAAGSKAGAFKPVPLLWWCHEHNSSHTLGSEHMKEPKDYTKSRSWWSPDPLRILWSGPEEHRDDGGLTSIWGEKKKRWISVSRDSLHHPVERAAGLSPFSSHLNVLNTLSSKLSHLQTLWTSGLFPLQLSQVHSGHKELRALNASWLQKQRGVHCSL